MAKYRVFLTAFVTATAEINVEAADEAEAEDKAMEVVQLAGPGQIQWDCDLNGVDDEAVEIDKIEEQ